MRQALDPASRKLLDAAIAVGRARGEALWAVGGALRDCAAGLPVRDLDLALAAREGDAVIAFASAVAAHVDGTVRVRAPALGTASVETPAGHVDFAPLRSERYARPGALPTVTLGASIEADLARRDFTVNALALALAGEHVGAWLDPFGGLDDLAARRLRVLHARSFVDDATRLWRGARVAAQHRLRPDAETARLIADGVRWLAAISGERLYAEFRLTARRRYLLATLRLLERWGALRGTHAALELSAPTVRALRGHPGPHCDALAAALLLAPIARRAAVLERLRPPRRVRDAVEATARLLAAPAAQPDIVLLEALTATPASARSAARWLAPAEQLPLQRALARWERTRPHLDGPGVLRLGVRRGPDVGRVLSRLRRERYLGTLKSAAQARHAVAAYVMQRDTPARETDA